MWRAWTSFSPASLVVFLVLTLAPHSAAADACSCEHVGALKSEIARVLQLRDRHAAKRDELAKRLGDNPDATAIQAAKEDYLRFETGSGPGSAAEGLPPVAPDAPQAVAYVPRGAGLLQAHAMDERNGIPLYDDFPPGGDTRVKDVKKRKAEEDKWRKRKKDLCDFEDEKAVKESTAAGAACDGIARAALVHEQTHRATCRGMGFYAFWERGPVDLAADEVRAYEAELAVLASEMARVLKAKTTRVIRAAAGACPQCYLSVEAECIRAYDVSGGLGGVQIKDRVCNIYETYSLTSRGQSKVVFQMAPTNDANGQFVYSGTGGGATFAGTGRYSVALGDAGGTLTMHSGGTATVNGQVVQDDGSVSLKMTPLEKKCGE
jgi:hypothetical protein